MPNIAPTVWNTNYFRTTLLRRAVPVGVTLLGCLGCAPAAKAEIRLASWRDGGQLSPASTDLKVEIDPAAGMAKIISTSVYTNQSPTDFESEFQLKAPDNSIITQFSYWYKGQKTLARIVETNRARRIYSDATAPYHPRPRDPALVEMLARNSFQVRIAPIEAQKPLKMEFVWWQPLEKVGSEWRLTLPWHTNGAAEALSLKAHFSTPVQNLDAPALNAVATPQTLEFAQPANDAVGDTSPTTIISFESQQKPAMLQSRSGGDSYFVTIVPEAVWKNWSTWRFCHALHSHLLGDGRRLVAGRFAKSSPAKTIGYQTQNNTEASEKWWASLELDEMGRHDLSHGPNEAGIALSKRYGLPSAWTSWLAIPDSERQKMADIIDKEKIQQAVNDRERLGVTLANWQIEGKTNNPQYRSMLADFNALTPLAQRDKERFKNHETLTTYFRDAVGHIIRGMRDLGDAAEAKSQRDYIYNLLKQFPGNDDLKKYADQQVEEVERRDAVYKSVQLLTDQALQAILAGQPSADFEVKLRQVVPKDLGEYGFYNEPGLIANAAVKIRREQPAVSQQLENYLQVLVDLSNAGTYESYSKKDPASYLATAEQKMFGSKIMELRTQLGQEVIAHRENEARYAQLRQQMDEVLAQSQVRYQNTDPDLSEAIRKTELHLLQLQGTAKLDSAAVDADEAELKRLGQFVNTTTVEQATKEADSFWNGLNYIPPQWLIAVKQEGSDSADALRLKDALQKWLDAHPSSYYYYPYGDEYKAESHLREVEQKDLAASTEPIYEALAVERSKPQPDEAKVKAIVGQLEALQAASVYNKTTLTDGIRPHNWMIYQRVFPQLAAEIIKPTPDPTIVAGLSDRLAEVAPDNDYIYRRFWTGSEQNELRGTPQDYVQLWSKRFALRDKAHDLAKQLAKNPPIEKRRELRQEIAQWKQIDNQLRVRIGDPLIAVKAPQNARQVLAIFPNGELRQLTWNVQTAQWEVRFDVPAWASEGDYTVQIVVLFASGKRQHLTMHFTVDLQSPNGLGSLLHEGNNWQLKLETDALTDRVSAFLPWNERVEMQRTEGNTFTAQVTAPEQFAVEAAVVHFVLTDKAHNRTEVALDWK